MSYREWYENLLGKFGSLNEYIDDIRARRVGRDAILVQVGLEREEDLKMKAVLKWISARMGIIGRSRVLELKSALFTGILPIARAVDIKHRRICLACDENGLPVLACERNNCSVQDAKLIERLVSFESRPLQKGQAVLETPDLDRLLGEMLTMDRKEFFLVLSPWIDALGACRTCRFCNVQVSWSLLSDLRRVALRIRCVQPQLLRDERNYSVEGTDIITTFRGNDCYEVF